MHYILQIRRRGQRGAPSGLGERREWVLAVNELYRGRVALGSG